MLFGVFCGNGSGLGGCHGDKASTAGTWYLEVAQSYREKGDEWKLEVSHERLVNFAHGRDHPQNGKLSCAAC